MIWHRHLVTLVVISNGLARAYGRKAAPPGKAVPRYELLEARAKRGKLGIYTTAPLKSIARAKSNENEIVDAEQEIASTQKPEETPPATTAPESSQIQNATKAEQPTQTGAN